MKVKKRNGKAEQYCVEKIHKVLTWATEGISCVSISDIEMNANLNIFDGISTDEIHKVLIKSANDLVSEETPNYQYVAARLLEYNLRKQVWGQDEPPRLYEHIKDCVKAGVYDKEILQRYSKSEIHKIGKIIKHNRDDKYTYAGLQQLVDKYLIKNRHTGEIYETPQFAYILIAMTGFINYPAETRFDYIKNFYNAISTFKISLPTPIMAGLRTPIRQFASCILIDVGDSLDSIFSSVSAVGYYSAKRAGIGLNVGAIRPIGSPIRGGEVISTGVIPYLKTFESVVKSTSQNGIRGASGTVCIPVWHYEIEDVIVLKNNAGTDDNRVKKLDYCIQFSKLFYERIVKNENITLFSPDECPELYEKFGLPGFDELYLEREKDAKVKFKRSINARELISLIAKERIETGRIYIQNLDHCNSHGSFTDKVTMTNLCTEITFPTKPLKHIDDEDAEIGVCILSSVNLLETKLDEIENVSNLIVRFLDEIIDYQTYPVKAAENFCKNRRALGVGVTNLAAFLASCNLKYDDKECLNLISNTVESLQYNLLKASVDLAKEKGACKYFTGTKYSQGILPIDTYKKDVDSLTTEVICDWEFLRKEILEHGLRHSTLTAQMPVESSSVIQNATNGIEPIRKLISYKKAKTGVLKQVVPNFTKNGKYYTKAFEIRTNNVYNSIAAVIQKWMDQAISLNHYYNYEQYEGGDVPYSVIIGDILDAYRLGIKTLYYANTPDGDDDTKIGCESGACAL